MSEEQFDTNEAREAVRNFDDARAGSHSETIAGIKVAVRLSKAIDEIERLRSRLDAVNSHDLEEWFVLEQTARNQERVIRELSDALAQTQTLKARLEALEDRFNKSRLAVDQRVVGLQLDVSAIREKLR